MLILTRKPNESIYIGDDIEIIYLGNNSPRQCKLGFIAPKDMKIHRSEIRDQIKRIENAEKSLEILFSDYESRPS